MTQGAAEDLWHLSIDDLFVTPVETPPLEGPGPFVINLSASTAPISIPATGVSGFETLKLYQLSRKEDGRDRFRLRLGFFDTPAAATEALAALRERYPSAFATNATEDDQRFNPARPRPPKAEPVVAPAAQHSSAHAHARNAVRSDAGRRGKKKDVRRDHAAHPRGTDTHGMHRNKPAPRNGHDHAPAPAKSALHVAQLSAVKEEKIDVESILLAALAPATPGKLQSVPEKSQPMPGKSQHQINARHTGKAGHGSKHSRAHSKLSEAKRHASRPVTKSSEPAPAVAAPPVVVPAPSQPVAAKPETPMPIPAPAAAQLVEVLLPTKSPIPVVPTPVLAEVALPVPSNAPERIEAPVDVDNEANIVTHPRIDEPPAANSEPLDADIPIDLHFIDRIFDDDAPTVEVLALESPDGLPTAEPEPKEIVEPISAKQEPARETAPEPQAIAKPLVEPEAAAIFAHDIIALLTQPIPTVRASQHQRASRSAAAPVPQTPAPVPTAAAPSALLAAEIPNADRESPLPTMPESEPEPVPVAAETASIEDEIPTLTEVARAESPPPTAAPVETEEVSSSALPAQTKAEADASVGAIAAGIESELELIMPAEVTMPDEAPAAIAEPAVIVDEAPSVAAPIELELELVPEAPSVPVLSEIFEEVIVAQVIPTRREPPPVAKSLTSARETPPAAHAAPVPPPPVSVPQLPAESIFKVKNRPAQKPIAAPAAPAAPAIKRPVVIFDAPIEDMDSTQTLRALTPLELNDDSQSKWFAVQLALSEDPVKVESLPHIDIFDEYRLYSISGIEQGKFLHSLRIGFFSAESSAQAVAGYLRASFEDAAIKRVSIAEHDRFAERKVKPQKKSESEPLAARASEAKRTDAQSAAAPSSTTHARDNGSSPVRKSRGSVDSSPTGRHKTLGEELYDEAREIGLSQSAIRRLPKNSSLWSRLFGQDKGKQ